LKVKEECRTKLRDKLLHTVKCKDEFGKIMDYVDSLHYEDRVDYSYVYEMLKTVRIQFIHQSTPSISTFFCAF
uniref:Cullin domain-containing protein n=1 Tax=Anisakis simplex TaxID=6269 RepID=A0A0M3JJ88_ANISI